MVIWVLSHFTRFIVIVMSQLTTVMNHHYRPFITTIYPLFTMVSSATDSRPTMATLYPRERTPLSNVYDLPRLHESTGYRFTSLGSLTSWMSRNRIASGRGPLQFSQPMRWLVGSDWLVACLVTCLVGRLVK